MRGKHFVQLLCAFTLLGLLAACARNDSSTPASGGRHPFSVDIMGGDGARVSWQGYTDGYRPGTAETMRLAVNNNTGQAWNGRFCVQLLEPMPSSVVIPLAEQEFSLKSDGGFAQDVRVELPADLTLGIHGLALVVHEPTGPIVDVIPVQVGEGEGEPFQGDWPTEAALDTCPAPQSASGGSTPQPGDTPPYGEGQPPSGRIKVDSVEVTVTQVIVGSKSNLPDGNCVSTELWASGVPQGWWPNYACAPVQDGLWWLAVPLEPEQRLTAGVERAATDTVLPS